MYFFNSVAQKRKEPEPEVIELLDSDDEVPPPAAAAQQQPQQQAPPAAAPRQPAPVAAQQQAVALRSPPPGTWLACELSAACVPWVRSEAARCGGASYGCLGACVGYQAFCAVTVRMSGQGMVCKLKKGKCVLLELALPPQLHSREWHVGASENSDWRDRKPLSW
jgi:hypothetical protein